MRVKIPARRGLYLLALTILAIAANTQVAFALSDACSSLNVQETSQAGDDQELSEQTGSPFAAGEEFVFAVQTQNSHPSEMVAGSPDHGASANALWFDDLGSLFEYRPSSGAELDSTVIIPINVTSNYTFMVMGSTLADTGVPSQGSASMTLTCRTSGSSPSNDATLSSLTIDSGTLSPTFSSGTTTYTASVVNGVNSLTVKLTSNGVTATSGQGFPVDLNVGSNTIEIEATAADGVTTKPHTLTVTRASATPSIVVSTSHLSPALGASVTFTATLSNGSSPSGTGRCCCDDRGNAQGGTPTAYHSQARQSADDAVNRRFQQCHLFPFCMRGMQCYKLLNFRHQALLAHCLNKNLQSKGYITRIVIFYSVD